MSEPAVQPEPQGVCRLGTPEDRAAFVGLWRDYLTEMHKGGSNLLPNEHNLYRFWDYFDAYTTGRLDGVVAFWSPNPQAEPAGVVMAGDEYVDSGWDTVDEGRRARLWGVYVSPSYRGARLGLRLETFGARRLLELGFCSVVSGVRPDNPLGQANQRHWNEHSGVQAVEVVIVAQLAPST